jgi:hypothetical protein
MTHPRPASLCAGERNMAPARYSGAKVGWWRKVMDMDTMTATHTLIASDRVEGTPVRRTNGQKIGTIERVMIDKLNGNVAYAVLTFGGFLGMGRKHMPIPWSRLHYDPKLGAYQIDLSDRDLDAIRADEDFDWGDRPVAADARAARIPGYWGAY